MEVPAAAKTRACRMGVCAAWTTLVGILLSGPLAILLLHELRPQPPWQDAELWNVLVFGMSILVLLALKQRLRGAEVRAPVRRHLIRVHAGHA